MIGGLGTAYGIFSHVESLLHLWVKSAVLKFVFVQGVDLRHF